MAGFAVKTTFSGKDNVTKTFGKMSRSAKTFGKTSSRAFRDASRGASRFGDITKGVLTAGFIQRGLSQLTTGLGAVTRQFIDFDKATIGAATRFKDIGPDALNFEEQLRKIRDVAREAGATTEFTADQAASALDFMARASFSSAEAFGGLASMINLATASGEDFATVADFSSDLLGSFGLNVDNTAQKIANLTRLNDVLVKAANTANVTIEDLFQTMKDVGPIAIKAGQSLESVTAVTAFLGGTGIKGTKAMTALKNAFLNLASPGTKASVMLDELGVKVADGQGNMRDLNTIIGELAPQLKKMGNVKAIGIVEEIFGKFAIAGALNIGDGTEAIKNFEKALLSAAGTSEKTAERLRKAMGNRLLALGSAATEFGFKIIEVFEVQIEGAIDSLTETFRNFDPLPLIIALGTTVEIIKTLWNVLQPFVPFMPWFIGMWVTFGTVMKVLAIAKMISSFLLFWNAIRLVSGSMAVFNAILIANPIGAVIVGIAALIAAVIFLEKKWQVFSTAFVFWRDLIMDTLKFLEGLAGKPFALAAKAFEFLGLEGGAPNEARQRELDQARTVPPNRAEAAAKQQINFKGRLDIAGAPEGSTVSGDTTGAAPIDLTLLGDPS